MGYVGVGWGGGVNVLSSAYSKCCYAAEISGMLATLLRCRDLFSHGMLSTLHVATICYAAEISGMFSTLHVATLPRSLECFLLYMWLRCRDLWNAFYVTCCYAAKISGMLSTLLVAALPRSLECFLRYMLLRCPDLWNAFYVTCCCAAEISGMLSTLHVATLPNALLQEAASEDCRRVAKA